MMNKMLGRSSLVRSAATVQGAITQAVTAVVIIQIRVRDPIKKYDMSVRLAVGRDGRRMDSVHRGMGFQPGNDEPQAGSLRHLLFRQSYAVNRLNASIVFFAAVSELGNANASAHRYPS